MIGVVAASGSPARPAGGGRRRVVRLIVSPEHAAELAALGKSAGIHAALLLVLAVAGWLSASRLPPMQSTRVRLVGAAPPQAVASTPAHQAPEPKPTPAAPERAVPPREPPPAEASAPPPEPAGVAPPRVEAPPKPAPRPVQARPKPSRPAPVTKARADQEPSTTPAPAAAPAASVAAAEDGLAASVEGGVEGLPDFYLDEIVRKVSSRWLKPASGLPPSQAIVYFEISRAGSISPPRLERPSGSPSFDRAALRAVELAAPFGRIPASRISPILKVHFEFAP